MVLAHLVVSVEDLHVIILIPDESAEVEERDLVSVEDLHVIILIHHQILMIDVLDTVSVEDLHVIILIPNDMVDYARVVGFSRRPACYDSDTVMLKSCGSLYTLFQSKTCML